MALVSLRQLLDHAAENGYGLPAFKVNNLEQVQAIMEAANETQSPVILQASAGARKYAGEAYLRHLVLAAIETHPDIPIVMHKDHGAIRRAHAENPAEFDIRKSLGEAHKAVRDICKARFETFGCAGMAPKIKPIALGALAKRYH
jgi:fructose/tagatose bisphosphate aldolase